MSGNTMIDAVVAVTEQANAIVQRVQASKSKDKGKFLANLRDNVDPSTISNLETRNTLIKYREAVAKMDALREKHVEAVETVLKATEMPETVEISEEEEKGLHAEYSALKGKRKAVLSIAGDFGATDEEIAGVPALLTLSGKVSGDKSEAGDTKRPRFDKITVNDAEVTGVTKSKDGDKDVANLTHTVTWLNSQNKDTEGWVKATTSELFEALKSAAGTDEFGTKNDITLAKFRGQYDITVYPKQAK